MSDWPIAPGHVARGVVFVSDLDASLPLYRDVLDMDVVSESGLTDELAEAFALGGREGRVAVLSGGSELGQVVLVEAEGLPASPPGRTDVLETGRSVLVLSSADLDSLSARLREAGAPRIGDPVPIATQYGEFAEFVSFDPDGAGITLLQFLPAEDGPQTEIAAPWTHDDPAKISPVIRGSFIVSDLDRAVEFYEGLVGMAVVERRHVDGSLGPAVGMPPCTLRLAYVGPAESEAPVGMGTICLTEISDPAPPTIARREARVVHAGQQVLAIAVDDVDAAAERLVAAGAPTLEGDTSPTTFFDPDDNLITLVPAGR